MEYSLGALVSLLLDIDLRELPFDGCCDGGVFRLSTGASKRIASMRGVFDRVAPGFRKYKIGFRQVLPFCVRQFCHSIHPLPFQSLYGHFNLEGGCESVQSCTPGAKSASIRGGTAGAVVLPNTPVMSILFRKSQGSSAGGPRPMRYVPESRLCGPKFGGGKSRA
jgi:hypothetical protein